MPRPRFQKLHTEKRLHLLEISAKNFSAAGFDNASINKIFKEAGISKGAGYYYFDDKEDLFTTTIEFYFHELNLDVDRRLEDCNSNNFWERIKKIHANTYIKNIDTPWKHGVIKAAGRFEAHSKIMKRLSPIIKLTNSWLKNLIIKGQSLELIRKDLPITLLINLFKAIDDTGDQWLLTHQHTLSLEQTSKYLNQMINIIKNALSPPPDNQEPILFSANFFLQFFNNIDHFFRKLLCWTFFMDFFMEY